MRSGANDEQGVTRGATDDECRLVFGRVLVYMCMEICRTQATWSEIFHCLWWVAGTAGIFGVHQGSSHLFWLKKSWSRTGCGPRVPAG